MGSLEPGPPEQWYALAKKLEAALAGQLSLEGPDPLVEEIVAKVRKRGQKASTENGEVDREGFPIMHEVFEGNRADSTIIGAMLDALEKRQGKKEGATVVVDRGMASRENLELINYVVAAR